MAGELLERTSQPAELVSISGNYVGQDYAAADATPIYLSALTSFIVPNQTRDFAGEVYEVFHCLVEDIEPLVYAEKIFYMGCPVCKQKTSQPPSVPTRAVSSSALFGYLQHCRLGAPSASQSHWQCAANTIGHPCCLLHWR